ncbi:MAG: GMC family oxidoreductase, partial [Alphaproteobacteria bacterium]
SCEDGDPAYRGKTGPISARAYASGNPLNAAFESAVQQAGHPYTADYNASSQWGVSPTQHAITMGRARRSSPRHAYLGPAMGRRNLHVLTQAHATRILFEGHRAIGVEYLRDGKTHRAMASNDVVVSAGTYRTPQLLMLSGLGPADHLQDTGVSVLQDMPGVGQNLQDHLGSFVQNACTQPLTLRDATTFIGQTKAALNYLITGGGLLSHYPTELVAYLKDDPEQARPGLQFFFAPFLRAPSGSSVPSGTVMTRHGYCISWCQLRPASRGAVRLSSDDPLDTPSITHNYLAEEADRACHRQAVAMARDIHMRDAFAPYRAEELHPGSDCLSPSDVDRYISQTCHTHFHPVGTAAMGRDGMAVVDDQLRVHGTENLRVVDASIMPRLVGANTNIPTIMIAEKACDLITGRPPLPRQFPDPAGGKELHDRH